MTKINIKTFDEFDAVSELIWDETQIDIDNAIDELSDDERDFIESLVATVLHRIGEELFLTDE
jgi:predicted transcriptional regulator